MISGYNDIFTEFLFCRLEYRTNLSLSVDMSEAFTKTFHKGIVVKNMIVFGFSAINLTGYTSYFIIFFLL